MESTKTKNTQLGIFLEDLANSWKIIKFFICYNHNWYSINSLQSSSLYNTLAENIVVISGTDMRDPQYWPFILQTTSLEQSWASNQLSLLCLSHHFLSIRQYKITDVEKEVGEFLMVRTATTVSLLSCQYSGVRKRNAKNSTLPYGVISHLHVHHPFQNLKRKIVSASPLQ